MDKWIGVDDELPEEGKPVLVYGKSQEWCNYAIDYMDKGDWMFWGIYNSRARGFDIIAWRYLPDPPESTII